MQFSFISPKDRALLGATTLGQSGPGSVGQCRGALHSPKLHHHWNLTILPFLYIWLINDDKKLKFKGDHKSTNKNNHIHFVSHYNTKIKNRILIGLYFRVLRIHSTKFLNDELDYKGNSFLWLQYSKSYILCAKIWAFKIHKQKNYSNNYFNNFWNINLFHRYIISPNNFTIHVIEKM